MWGSLQDIAEIMATVVHNLMAACPPVIAFRDIIYLALVTNVSDTVTAIVFTQFIAGKCFHLHTLA